MSEEQIEQKPLTSDDKNRILLIESLIRMNSAYKVEALEKKDSIMLEALYEAEKSRANSKPEAPKPSFLKAPIAHKEPATKIEKKENSEPAEFRFNALEVFKRQYVDPSRLKKYEPNCTILTMRVNANPKYPEWQVS